MMSLVVMGRSGGAIVLGKLLVPSVLLILIIVGQEPIALAIKVKTRVFQGSINKYGPVCVNVRIVIRQAVIKSYCIIRLHVLPIQPKGTE